MVINEQDERGERKMKKTGPVRKWSSAFEEGFLGFRKQFTSKTRTTHGVQAPSLAAKFPISSRHPYSIGTFPLGYCSLSGHLS